MDSFGGLGGRNTSHHKAVQEDNDWALADFGLDRSRLPGLGVLLFYHHPNDNDNYFIDSFSPRTTSSGTNQPTPKTTKITNTLWDLDKFATTTTSSAPPASAQRTRATLNTSTQQTFRFRREGSCRISDDNDDDDVGYQGRRNGEGKRREAESALRK